MRMLYITGLLMLTLATACSTGGSSDTHAVDELDTIPHKQFDSDSAYAYVKDQVDFGPRVPGTEAHEACAKYLEDKLRSFGADSVGVQSGVVTAFTGNKLPIKNIFARFKGDYPKRVLLVAHWDSRPWADQEDSADNRAKPVPGANDGASGVGVALEIARLLGDTRADVGVDILLADAEDYGRTEGWGNSDETWCLGTQYWLKSQPYAGESLPAYGILLDMVGARDAKFHREYISDHMAKAIVDKVWSRAAISGFADRFVNEVGGGVTDDHLFLNQAGIPCIDIIENCHPDTRTFHPSWHTLRDDMSVIDRETLRSVGQVVINVIYNELPK